MKIKMFAIAIIAIIGFFVLGSLFGLAGAGVALAVVPGLAFLDDIPDITEKERKFANGLIKEINDLQGKATLGLVKEEYVTAEIKKLSDQLVEIKSLATNTKFQEQLDNLTKELEAIKIGEQKNEGETLIQQIKKALTPEAIAKIQRKEKLVIPLEMKVDTMSITTSNTGNVQRVEHNPNMVWLPESMPMLSEIIASVPTNSNSVEIVEAYNELGVPIFHLEGDAAGQMSWKWRTKAFSVKDVGVWAKFSRNIMDDVDNFLGQIQNKLLLRLDKKVDEKLVFGDETDNPEEFNGLSTIASVFDNRGITTYHPTERDVIETAIGQVAEADHSANFVVMNPRDWNKLKVVKAGKDNAILQYLEPAGTIAGLRAVTSTRMTAGKFLVGDSSKCLQHIRLALELVLADQDGTNAQTRHITLVLTKRMAFEVSANNYSAFVYGDFTTAKTAMTLLT